MFGFGFGVEDWIPRREDCWLGRRVPERPESEILGKCIHLPPLTLDRRPNRKRQIFRARKSFNTTVHSNNITLSRSTRTHAHTFCNVNTSMLLLRCTKTCKMPIPFADRVELVGNVVGRKRILPDTERRQRV